MFLNKLKINAAKYIDRLKNTICDINQQVLNQERKEAERKIISAKGERDAQIIISEGLTDNVLKNKAIEVFRELSASKNSKIIITNGKTPLMISDDADKN